MLPTRDLPMWTGARAALSARRLGALEEQAQRLGSTLDATVGLTVGPVSAGANA